MNIEDDEGSYYESSYGYEDLTFLEACLDQDIDAVQAILDENITEEEINERDRSGRTGLSHTCSNGLVPIIEMLSEIPEVDPNLPDKEGNSPLIFGSQAGNTDVVRILLQDFKGIRIDQPNKLGFTALMKAAIQGRTDCARLLLYAGADPKLRDHGRKLCAEEWARYVGRKDCAEAIAKFSNTKRFCLKARLHQNVERCSSVPDLSEPLTRTDSTKQAKKRRGGSLRRKIKNILPHTNESLGINLSSPGSPFAVIARCVSTPVLPGVISPAHGSSCLRRPVSADNIPKVEVTIPVEDEGMNSVPPNMIARRKAAKKTAQMEHGIY